jgi:hypothetical protein
MLSIESFGCKGVNPFYSHLHDKKWSDHRAKQTQKSRFRNRLLGWQRIGLNHSARVLVIWVMSSFVAMVLNQVIAANAQPHGDGCRHEHG